MPYDEDEDAKKTVFIRTAIEGHTAGKKTKNDYGSLLCSAIYDLHKAGSYTDYEIRLADDSRILCHKMILAIGSPYFKTAFNSGLADTCEKEIDMSHLDADVMKDIVRFFYTGEIVINTEHIVQVLQAASFLAIDDVLIECEKQILGSDLIKEDAIGYWLDIGQLFGLKKVIEHCTRYWLMALSVTEEFQKLKFVDLMKILNDDEIEVNSEDDVLEACINWVMFDQEKRKQHLEKILDKIRLTDCSSAYIDTLIEKYGSIFPDTFQSKNLRRKFERSQLDLQPRLMQSIEKMLLVYTDTGHYLLHPSGKWKSIEQEGFWNANFDLEYRFNRIGVFAFPSGFISFKSLTWAKFHNTCRKTVTTLDIDKKILSSCIPYGGNLFIFERKYHAPIQTYKFDIRTANLIRCADGPDRSREKTLASDHMPAVVINTNIYILELIEHSKKHYFHCYNTENDSWKTLRSLKEYWNAKYNFTAYSYGKHIVFVPQTYAATCLMYHIDHNYWQSIEPPHDMQAIYYSVCLSHVKFHDEIVFLGCRMDFESDKRKIDTKLSLSLKTLIWSKSSMCVPRSMSWVLASEWVDVPLAYRLEPAEDDMSTYEEAESPLRDDPDYAYVYYEPATSESEISDSPDDENDELYDLF